MGLSSSYVSCYTFLGNFDNSFNYALSSSFVYVHFVIVCYKVVSALTLLVCDLCLRCMIFHFLWTGIHCEEDICNGAFCVQKFSSAYLWEIQV